jgi:hypothetical protein
MNTTLDGQAIFDEQDLTVTADSVRRACVERAVGGLDGVMSIDLGARVRQIRQTGVLRATGRAALSARIDVITAFIDGGAHTLRTADGRAYHNLRMDTFQRVSERTGGPGVVIEYEIVYAQLGG